MHVCHIHTHTHTHTRTHTFCLCKTCKPKPEKKNTKKKHTKNKGIDENDTLFVFLKQYRLTKMYKALQTLDLELADVLMAEEGSNDMFDGFCNQLGLQFSDRVKLKRAIKEYKTIDITWKQNANQIPTNTNDNTSNHTNSNKKQQIGENHNININNNNNNNNNDELLTMEEEMIEQQQQESSNENKNKNKNENININFIDNNDPIINNIALPEQPVVGMGMDLEGGTIGAAFGDTSNPNYVE